MRACRSRTCGCFSLTLRVSRWNNRRMYELARNSSHMYGFSLQTSQRSRAQAHYSNMKTRWCWNNVRMYGFGHPRTSNTRMPADTARVSTMPNTRCKARWVACVSSKGALCLLLHEQVLDRYVLGEHVKVNVPCLVGEAGHARVGLGLRRVLLFVTIPFHVDGRPKRVDGGVVPRSLGRCGKVFGLFGTWGVKREEVVCTEGNAAARGLPARSRELGVNMGRTLGCFGINELDVFARKRLEVDRSRLRPA